MKPDHAFLKSDPENEIFQLLEDTLEDYEVSIQATADGKFLVTGSACNLENEGADDFIGDDDFIIEQDNNEIIRWAKEKAASNDNWGFVIQAMQEVIDMGI